MTVRLTGTCHCGNIYFELTLTSAPGTYQPRVCDCIFCHKHGASYVSDPQGSLRFHIHDECHFGKYRQGSRTADCLVCQICGVLVGITYVNEGQRFGTVNIRAINDDVNFAEAMAGSPKKLAVCEKLVRWKDLWFSDVIIDKR